MNIEKPQESTSHMRCQGISGKGIETIPLQTQEKIALALGKKLYWSVPDLERKGVLSSQQTWDQFKDTSEYGTFMVPGIVKGVLMARNIIP